jgi:hypothetical protein
VAQVREWSEAKIDREEARIPHNAKTAFEAAYRESVEAGAKFLITRGDTLIEVSEQGERIVGKVAPSVPVRRRVLKLRWTQEPRD